MIDPITLLGAVPTVMNTLNTLGDVFNNTSKSTREQTQGGRYIYRQGGKTTKSFEQYNAPSHEQGGQNVNEQGIPTANGEHEIEKQENKFTYKNIKRSTYIFPGESAKQVNKLVKKYKNADTDPLVRNTLELEIQKIEQANEMRKAKQNKTKQYKQGGKTYREGGPTDLLTGNPRNYSLPSDKQFTLPTLPVSNFLNTPKSTEQKLQDTFADYKPSLPKTKVSRPGDTLETLRNISLFGNSLQLFNRAEKENPIFTDYGRANAELNNMSANLDPARENAVQGSNAMRNINRGQVSSYNQFSNRESQRLDSLRKTLGEINLSELGLKNNIAGQRSQMFANQALDNKQTIEQNRINNQMNQANNRNIKRQIGADILYELDRRSTIENNRQLADATVDQGMVILQNMFPNMTWNVNQVKAVQDYQRKKITKAEYEKIMAQEPVQFKQ